MAVVTLHHIIVKKAIRDKFMDSFFHKYLYIFYLYKDCYIFVIIVE